MHSANYLTAQTLSGIYVPLVTPFYRGALDPRSLKKLIHYVAPSVDGYVPCLSSGEGALLSDAVWKDVVYYTRSFTNKPVIAGIKRNSLADTIKLAGKADKIGCAAVMVPVPYAEESESLHYFSRLTNQIALPVVVYNTEQNRFKSLAAVKELQRNDSIIGMKDSSMNKKLFSQMCAMRVAGKLRFPVFQGMEHQMQTPIGCDGYIVSLANVEPRLCRLMVEKNSAQLYAKIIEMFWQYNLGGNWYVSLKSQLRERQIIRSAEETQLAIKPQ